MCWEDVKIARKTVSNTRLIALGNGIPFEVAIYSNRRWHISVWLCQNGGVYISRERPTTTSQGIQINTASQIFSLNLLEHGSLVYGPFWAYAGIGQNIYVMESVLEDQGPGG